jgi:hypothetical protein
VLVDLCGHPIVVTVVVLFYFRLGGFGVGVSWETSTTTISLATRPAMLQSCHPHYHCYYCVLLLGQGAICCGRATTTTARAVFFVE